MSYNGSGTYAAPASTWNPAVTNTAINSTDWIALLADLTTALSTCMLKDGQQTPTANIPMGGFKFTGLAAGSAAGNSIRYEQLFTTGQLTLLGGLTTAGPINTVGAVNETKTTVASATTPDIWTSVGNVVDYTGTVTATGFAAAPQAGARRTLICAGAAVFTAGANMLIDGIASGSNYTAIAGDRINVVAVTTTQFRLTNPHTPFVDTYPIAQGSTDATKQVRLEVDGVATATTRVITVPDFDVTLGVVAQRTYQEYTANADLTTVIPADDTIPQITEGTEIMSQAITPKNASNRIRIRFQCFASNSGAAGVNSAALFVDSTANALVASASWCPTATGAEPLTLEYEESAASVSSRTYRLRVGPATGTLRLNGQTTGRLFGGVARATLVIEEIS